MLPVCGDLFQSLSNTVLSYLDFFENFQDTALAHSFSTIVFKPTWFGLLPYATTGEDFHPGATRSYTFPTSIGIYNITEELTLFHTSPSGSFIWKLEQAPSSTPTEYRTGNGSFSGYWATMKSDAVFQNETSIVWSVYLCATGHPLSKCSPSTNGCEMKV